MEVVPFLGILVDFRRRCLRVSRAKAAKLQALCEAILALGRVSLRNLQRFGGLLAFLATATPDASFCRKGVNLATAEAERLPGRTVGVKGMLRDDLMFWQQQARYLPTRTPAQVGEGVVSVCTDAAGAPLRGFGAVAWPGTATTPDIDAVLEAHSAIVGDHCIALFGPLPHMGNESSSALETEAFRRAVKRLVALRPAWVVGNTIHWFSDSQSAVSAVTSWRSKSVGLSRAMHQLFLLLRKHNVRVVPHWVSRSLQWMPVADWLSRLWWRRAAAEWSLPQPLVAAAIDWAGWQPTVDLFAVGGNQQVAAYATRYPTKGALCDAFGRSWDGLRGWAYPPFSQLTRLWRHLAAAKDARVLVVMPLATSVPDGVTVVGSYSLPRTALVDPRGDTAADLCPVLLTIRDVRNGLP
jgi:hypothetical protein